MEDLNYSMVTPSKNIIDWLKDNIGIKEIDIKTLANEGSSRSYHRISATDGSWVLQQSEYTEQDFHRFVDYANVFSEFDLNAPRVLVVDEEASQVLMNDLGDNRLYEYSKVNLEQSDVYKDVIDELVEWQELSPKIFTKLPQLENRFFDLDHLFWESNYFKENTLHKHLGFSREQLGLLDPYLEDLANRVNQHPHGIVHRDFQSQNIIISDLEAFFIDFQSARNGSLFYDIASLLWDPYVVLDDKLVEELFTYFIYEHPILNEQSRDEYYPLFLDASLQRLMQACGAFCFLSQAKHKDKFSQFIEPGLAQLRKVAEKAGANELLKFI